MLRLVAGLIVVISTVAFAAVGRSAGQAQQSSLPKFETARKLVRLYFERQDGYEQGDIITREQATEAFRYLTKIHWKVRDQKEILAALYSEKDFLPRTLRTKTGRPFMREIAKLPHGYDRLDRMSRLPRGERMVSDLASEPDGYKMIEYLADTKGGDNLGKLLSNAPRGKDFNQPTGRIYTEDAFVRRLKESYEAEQAESRNSAGGTRQVVAGGRS